MDEFRIGSSYYPEWWDEKEWEEDFSKMEALGFNTVRMGEFAWSWFEPEEGKYNFEPMLRAVSLAEKHNIKVIMGTVTAICPPWLYKKYPEVKGSNEKGPYSFGGRKGQCLSSKIFLEYAERITRAQLKAMGGHKNIIGWQIDNEPGFPFLDYSPLCQEEFRQWLKNKYKTIDRLNKAWFSMMWSNYYNDFDEIFIPVNSSESGWTAEIQLDYRRFFSFTFNRLLRMEAEIVREYSPGRFLYTNWPGANWSVDCYEGEKYLDYAGWDNYVEQPNGENYRSQLKAAMEHSFDRRLSGGKEKFLVAEQPGLTDADTLPEVIRAQTWWNVAHGAFATLFFEWRMPLGGAEQDYECVMGRDKKVRAGAEPVYKKLISELSENYGKISGASTPSEIAVLYSYENSWAKSGWRVDGFYDTEIFNSYGGFHNALKTNVDIASIDDDLSRYKIIVLPDFTVADRSEAEKIKSYVEKGGIAVLNASCGNRDKTNKSYEAAEPGLFSGLCGVYSDGKISAAAMEKNTGEKCFAEIEGRKYQLTSTLYRIKTKGAEVIGTYTCGKLKGSPAVTVNSFGKGYAVFFATEGLDVYFYEALASYIGKRFGIKPLAECSEGVLCASRIKQGREYIIAVNMKESEGTVRTEDEYLDVLSGKTLKGNVKIGGYDVMMLTKK